MQTPGVIVISLLLALAAACPTARPASGSSQAESYKLAGTLASQADTLTWQPGAGGERRELNAAAAQPYQVVALGPPALVTTCGPDLEPCTYIIAPGTELREYTNWLPLAAAPPLAALGPVPAGEADLGLGLILLKPDGSELYHNDNAELLLPAHELAAWDTSYIVETAGDGTAIYPLGNAPQLTALDLASGDVLWRTEPAPQRPPGDIALWAVLDNWLLLSLQYNFEAYEFVAVNRENGALGESWQLNGMPGGTVVFPGPAWEPTEPERDGTCASLVVFNSDAGAWQRWRFDCAAGALMVTDCEPPQTQRENNALPVGGSGAPGPGQAPFPQRLLPAAWGTEWNTAALLDGAGRVLVVDGAGARWVKAEE